MPLIPTLDNQVRPQEAPNVQRRPLQNTASQSVAAGIGNASDVLFRVQQEEQLKADRAAFMDADRQTDTVANDIITNAQKRIGKDAIGSGPELLGEFDKRSSEILNGLKTPRQKAAFQESLNNRRSQLQRNLDNHEGQQRESYYAKSREDYKDQAHINAVTNYRDPKAIDAEIDKIRATIDQTPGMDAAQRETELGVRRSGVYAGVIDRYLANDVIDGAEKYYKSIRDKVNGDTATQIEARINAAKDRERNKRDAALGLARAELQDEVRNIEAATKLRIPVTNVPSEARFVALYGERGKKMHEQVSKFAALSVDAAKLDQMASADIVKLAEGHIPTKVEGAAAQAELAGIIGAQAREVLKARADDSVAYLQQYSPTVQEATKAFSENPTDATRNPYLTALRGERQRLGIPGDDILSRQDEAAVVDRMTRFDDTQNLTDSIRSEAARWGKDWPLVFAQVGDKLPDTAFFIGTGISDKASGVVGATVGLSDDELKKRLPAGTTMKNVTDDVADGLDEFTASFPIDGTIAASKVLTGTEKLVIGYLGQGMSYSDAKKASIKETTEKYQFLTFRDHTYRVPRDIDANLVDEGATKILRNFKPPDRLIPNGATIEQVSDLYKRNSYWVTNEDETGLILFMGGEPVGKPAIRYSWDQLRAAGMDANKPIYVPYEAP
jgi:hypothetical protein